MASDIPKLSGNRIINADYESHYQQNELYHLANLSTYLQATYPNLKFHIMFIGNDLNPSVQLNYNVDSKIIVIPNQTITMANYEQVIDKIFADHGAFISNCVNA